MQTTSLLTEAGVRDKLAGAGELQALDDGGLAGIVGAHNECEGPEEGDQASIPSKLRQQLSVMPRIGTNQTRVDRY